MSRGRKSEYPFRPDRKRRPKSSQSGGGRRKTWASIRDRVEGGRDVSDRLNLPWWKSPMYRDARLAKANSLKEK